MKTTNKRFLEGMGVGLLILLIPIAGLVCQFLISQRPATATSAFNQCKELFQKEANAFQEEYQQYNIVVGIAQECINSFPTSTDTLPDCTGEGYNEPCVIPDGHCVDGQCSDEVVTQYPTPTSTPQVETWVCNCWPNNNSGELNHCGGTPRDIQSTGTSTPESEGYNDCTQIN